jgi:hypothetical protein
VQRSIVIAVAATLGTSLAAQSTTPPGWRWSVDPPAPDSGIAFDMMPPGYHVTTGPALALFNPAYRADGVYTLESEIFVFPSSTDGEYGLFIGGVGLEVGGGTYTAFVARRDGSIAVLRRAGAVTPLVPWTRHDSVKTPDAGEPVKNVLRVAVERAAVVFSVNGAEVARVARDSAGSDGLFGFRMGSGLNLHVTTLDYTRRLAPPRNR